MANNTALVAGNQPQQQAMNKPAPSGKHGNVLPLWGNEKTMNLNPMILTNVLSSPYFKVQLYELKTYHEVVDEIYFKVTHIEPWEKGSRKTAGQTGMCGGLSRSPWRRNRRHRLHRILPAVQAVYSEADS
ncbi:hypothetical protein MATL_G00244080 [Megalops atlanticus]|uniref:Pre-mRNA-splicing factor 38B n=1 Tax=Megalops atlanticus TaxID=7932 RepID=A0A9D3PH85_MEGAT|nr:hypothetical protein MATL_G00244080 [Megalops atlanticus]